MKPFLFPTPKSASFTDKTFRVKSVLPTDSLMLFCSAAANSDDIVYLRDDTLGAEAYRIDIGDGVRVTFAADTGRFYALTTLFQLTKQYRTELPCGNVADEPDFARRGYMLDISRGRMPKVGTIKRLIDRLALLKYNELQLYMESFCFKYSAYPAYTESIDCLTPEDIRELERYCKAYHIDLVPNQNSLGHMGTWLAEPAFHSLGIGDETTSTDTLNPLLPETAGFLDGLYGSLLPHFSSRYVNVGLDESWGLGRFQTAAYCKEHGVGTLYRKHLDTVKALVQDKYGKKMMYWADAVGDYRIPPETLPKDAIALEWGYDAIQFEKMTAHCIGYAAHGVPFYVCPSCNTHCSLTGRTDVMLNNIRTAAELGKKYGAVGFLLTDWGDNGHPQFPVWSYVPIALGGEYAWNTGEPITGWDFKAEKVRAACAFTDTEIFGGHKIANDLLRIGNYYLLETERLLNATQTNHNLFRTLDTDKVPLKDYEDVYAAEDIIRYAEHYLSRIAAQPIDNHLKRQIAVNVQMVILASESGIIRVRGSAGEDEKKRLAEMIGAIIDEYTELWDMDNYPKGKEILIDKLEKKAAELSAL